MQRAAQVILVVSLFWALWMAAYWLRFQDSTLNHAVAEHPWMLSLVALAGASLMLRTLVPGTVSYRIFNLRWLRAIGTVSYGAYIFHDIFHSQYSRFLAHRLTNPVLVVLLTAVLGLFMTLAMAFLSYHFFEYPILRLKGSFYVQAHPRILFGRPSHKNSGTRNEREKTDKALSGISRDGL
jgi:peptidoglycan/LPS O-acetylase OafA/YrhL